MMGELRHAIGEASGYGKAGGDDFSGLFRFICKIANLCSRLHCGGKVYFLAPLPLGSTWNMVPMCFCVPGILSHRLFLSFVGGEGSAETGQKETSTCDICQFGAECDVDAEDVW